MPCNLAFSSLHLHLIEQLRKRSRANACPQPLVLLRTHTRPLTPIQHTTRLTHAEALVAVAPTHRLQLPM
eukprot:1484794-Lingulodinium_polyedra.AAC.1